MTAIIPFDSQVPAVRKVPRASSINRDILGSGGAQYPVLSIKGKVFTLVKGSEKRVITREIDGEEEPVSSLQVAFIRANTKYRVFYASAYSEGESDGKKPTCFSNDSIAPDSTAAEPQSKKCQGCPQNIWGVKDGKGTACGQKTRVAVIDPNNPVEPLLLSIPPASRKAFMVDVVEFADKRNLDYNEVAVRVAFDKDAPSPKLTFKPIGELPDDAKLKMRALYDDEIVQEMVGVPSAPREAAPALPMVSTEDLEEAIAPAKVVTKVAPAAKPAPVLSVDEDEIEEIVKPKAVVKKPAAKATATVGDTDALLADMDALLGNKDD